METVNKYVHAASNAIWGQDGTPNATQTTQQHGEEPLSGVQGTGDATDPYDAGNRDEQPDAPKSDGNTAPQEPIIGSKQQSFEEAAITSAKVPASNVPIIGGKPQSFEEAALTSAKVPASTVPIIGGKPQSFEEAAVTSDPTPKSTTIDTEDTSPSTAAAASNSTAQPISSGSTESKKETSTSDKEQRNSSNPEGESSETPRQAAHVDASKEALQGPQGPPPKTAEEFEKESKGKKPAVASDNVEKSPTRESKDTDKSNESPTSSNKSEHSQENGKNSKLAKVKESVKKHLHHSSK